MAAVVVTWLDSRRITRHLNRTIDRLIDTDAELRLLLDDLPEAVMSVDDDGVVRGANAKTAELTGRPVSSLVGAPLTTLVETIRSDEQSGISGVATRRTTSPTGWRAVGAATQSRRSRCGCCMRNDQRRRSSKPTSIGPARPTAP